MNDLKQSVIEMASGAIMERVDYEVGKVVDNILDINTDEKTKRKITLTLEFTPSQERQIIGIKASVTSKLAATMPLAVTTTLESGEDGNMQLRELCRQVPGQLDTDGQEVPKPTIMRLAQQG